MSSFAWALNSTAAPKEVQYLIPSARGNVATCAAQGCIVTAGITMATFYNCSICFYYLSVVTFNKKDEYIKRKLEPWFHGVPVISAIMIGIIGLIMKQYNTNGDGNCYLTNYHPPNCQGVTNGIIPEGFTIPCGRGGDTKSGNLFRLIVNRTPPVTPVIIIGTMVTMYRAVRKIERKMRNYGASVLRLRASRRPAQVVDGR